MTQARADSAMEAVTNTAVGFLVSMVTWWAVALAFAIPMPLAKNMQITAIFTATSLVRQYVLRRAFNGRSLWQAISKADSRGNDR